MMHDPTEAPRGGYRRAGAETWARARADYLAGDTADEVCARHDLRPGTLRARAAAEGWRRADAPEAEYELEPVDLDSDEAAELPGYADMARMALIHLNRAIRRGRAAEAASWMRLHMRLNAQAAAATPKPKPPPDPASELAKRAAAIGRLACDAAVVDPHDDAAMADIEARMTALGIPISDNSDNSDPVFSGSELENRPPAPPVGEDGEEGRGSEGRWAGLVNDPRVQAAPQPAVSPGGETEIGLGALTPAAEPIPPRSPPPAGP